MKLLSRSIAQKTSQTLIGIRIAKHSSCIGCFPDGRQQPVENSLLFHATWDLLDESPFTHLLLYADLPRFLGFYLKLLRHFTMTCTGFWEHHRL